MQAEIWETLSKKKVEKGHSLHNFHDSEVTYTTDLSIKHSSHRAYYLQYS